MQSPTPTDSTSHTPAPCGMIRRHGGWAVLPRPARLRDLPWEDKGPRAKPDQWTPTMSRLLRPEAGYPTLMDLVVQELLAELDEPPSDAP